MATSDSQTSAPNKGFDLLRRRVRGHQGMIIGSVIVVSVLLIALLAPLLAPHDPYQQDLLKRLVPPVWDSRGSWEHVLGTDHLGRDYLSRLIYGARISLLIGIGAALISGIIGTIMGVMAGYFGGRVDMIVTFMITVRLSMPVVLVALAVVAIVGGSLQVVIAVLGLLLWDRFAVVMRSSTLQIRSMDYVAAALSFLGLGVQPPMPSWGLMVSEGKDMMLFEPWLITIPGVALFLLVLAINLMGDGVRDITAPENRN